MKPTGTETVGTLMSTVLAQKLKAFCERVSLTQPQAIRTLIFNFVSADENPDRKTSFGRSARIQQRNFDNFDGAIVRVDAVLSTSQAKRLDRFCDSIGFYRGEIIRVLIRNFIHTTKPGKAEDAFLLTARQLMSRQPSSPLWGNGCERTAEQRREQAFDFMDEHNLSVGQIATALRGLGTRRSKRWIERWR